ncbi:hypothetical protein TIFTF001_006016 [Ficus carica]|uniref:Bifunctional inhibitor/plant lipid transfer protein/seed storage helical domain-containing protein n=1 Tax=Ficus carica TaxID=3494 RepID=A0AA87ZZK4_FICCA|nr:hypothetical protein TIFTF001_006016 [Ficus carica]
MGKKMVWSQLVLGMVMFLTANSSSYSRSTSPNDISCQDAVPMLLPCQMFLKGSPPPTPSINCCLGVQKVFQQANTTEIRRNLCECFKKAAIEFGVDPARARQLPELCKIDIPFPIDPNIDCTK